MKNNRNKEQSEAIYMDYANVTADQFPKTEGDSSVKYQIFPVLLHYILGELEKDGLDHIISWHPQGRSFIVHDRRLLEKSVLPM